MDDVISKIKDCKVIGSFKYNLSILVGKQMLFQIAGGCGYIKKSVVYWYLIETNVGWETNKQDLLSTT